MADDGGKEGFKCISSDRRENAILGLIHYRYCTVLVLYCWSLSSLIVSSLLLTYHSFTCCFTLARLLTGSIMVLEAVMLWSETRHVFEASRQFLYSCSPLLYCVCILSLSLVFVLLCSIDNSEWSRNGDFSPSRFESQKETINNIANAKIQSNPETTVGLLSLAGDRIEVHISLTRSPGTIMTALAKDVRIGGEANFLAGLKTAALALKNRQNKNQRQRIVLFVGSPVRDDVKELVRLGKTLKKNNIAVDVINFGTENSNNENAEKWEQFIEAVNTSDNSHLVNIPPGPHLLADMIATSPILNEGGTAPGRGATGTTGTGAPAAGGFGDIDANQDPEMALAIRMSMEEERARVQRLAAEAAGASGPSAGSAAATDTTTSTATSTGGTSISNEPVPMEEDEDALLQQAIAMSMQQEQPDDVPPLISDPAAAATETTTAANASEAESTSSTARPLSAADDIDAAMQDPDFINSLLASVTGTGTTDTDVRQQITETLMHEILTAARFLLFDFVLLFVSFAPDST